MPSVCDWHSFAPQSSHSWLSAPLRVLLKKAKPSSIQLSKRERNLWPKGPSVALLLVSTSSWHLGMVTNWALPQPSAYIPHHQVIPCFTSGSTEHLMACGPFLPSSKPTMACLTLHPSDTDSPASLFPATLLQDPLPGELCSHSAPQRSLFIWQHQKTDCSPWDNLVTAPSTVVLSKIRSRLPCEWLDYKLHEAWIVSVWFTVIFLVPSKILGTTFLLNDHIVNYYV